MSLIVLSLARDQVGFTKFCVSAVACALQIIAGSIDQSLGRSVAWFSHLVLLWFSFELSYLVVSAAFVPAGVSEPRSPFDHLFITSLRHLNLCQLEIEIDAAAAAATEAAWHRSLWA